MLARCSGFGLVMRENVSAITKAAIFKIFWRSATPAIVTVRQFEAGAHDSRRATLDVIRRAFETAGVEFIDANGGGPGVRLKKS